MPKKATGPRPSEVFARRLREVRARRGWTQQDLADRLAVIGEPVDRATVARTENGKRGVSLDDAVAYATALGPSLLNLMVPIEGDEPVALAAGLSVRPRKARSWLRGYDALTVDDVRVVMAERPAEDVFPHIDTIVERTFQLGEQIVDGAPKERLEIWMGAIEHSLTQLGNFLEISALTEETE